jgi:hypothetical protein
MMKKLSSLKTDSVNRDAANERPNSPAATITTGLSSKGGPTEPRASEV